MSVGGKVVQIYEDQESETPRIWVNTWDGGSERAGEYCAVFIEDCGHDIRLGDSLWWQGGNAFWTSKQPGAKAEIPIKRVGGSGVNHPMGKEYQLEGYKIAMIDMPKAKKWIQAMREMGTYATPTERSALVSKIVSESKEDRE